MKVVAVSPDGGYYDLVRRRNGDVFQIPDAPRRKPSEKEAKLPQCKEVMAKDGTVPESWSSVWMRKAPKDSAERTTGAQESVQKHNASVATGKPGNASHGSVPGSVEPNDGSVL